MPKKEPDVEEVAIRPFADFLREQARGHSHEELSEGLAQLVRRVQDTGKKGRITYTVNIAQTKSADGALLVTDEISLRLPEHDRGGSIFFADAEGNLQRTDPNQLAFESLREVPPPNVDPETGEIKEIKNA